MVEGTVAGTSICLSIQDYLTWRTSEAAYHHQNRQQQQQPSHLAKVGRERDHLAVVGILQPLQDDGGVQTAGIGQHHLVDAILSGVHLDVAGAMAHNTNADGAGAAHPGSAHRGVLGRDRRGCGKTATGSSVQISRVNLGKFGQVNLGQAGPNFTVGESTWPLGDSQQLLEGQQLSLLKPRATNSPPFETHQPP